MELYVSQDTIRSSADFFRAKDYRKPEQIGLFFYFKAAGLNEYVYTTYKKWGEISNADRAVYLRTLYDLAGAFDATCETGLKKTALFPFAITTQYRASNFYNGATQFSGLGSRISDTLDNALVSTIIHRNNNEPGELKLGDGYLQMLSDRYINGHKISLKYLAAWYYKFWKINMPAGTTEQDFQDVCVLGFIKAFNLSVEEYRQLFFLDDSVIVPSTSRITGTQLRDILAIGDDCAPEIGNVANNHYMSIDKSISEVEALDLLQLRGAELTEARIIEILSENDRRLQEEAAAIAAANNAANEVHEYTRDELMAMENKDFIFTSLEIMSRHSLFNGFTLPILESREQCTLLFRHNNIHGILFKRPHGMNDEEFRAAVQDDAGHSRYYADTYSIAEDEYYVSSQWRPDREDARGAFLDWLFELLLAIRFETGITSPFERNRIVFGAPGTGKSHTLKEDSELLLNGTTGSFERVTFHPEYTYSQFVGSYKPVTNAQGEIRYDFVPGPFMRVLVAALKSGRTENPQPHLLLIEEINRAKVAAVFGEVFQLLDRSDEGASEYEIHATEDIKKYLISELGKSPDSIKIPDNMFIWATMNSADQGVYPMDTAFKRRWNFEYIGIDDNDDEVGGIVELGTAPNSRDIDWNILRKAINDTLAVTYNINEDKLMGPYFLSKQVFAYGDDGRMLNPDKFRATFKSKVIMYLYEDAAKPVKHRLFEGCDSSKYSSVCAAFDARGIEIFGASFVDKYNSMIEG